MAHYTRYKVEQGTEVDAYDYMPHEQAPELTYEQQRLEALKKKST